MTQPKAVAFGMVYLALVLSLWGLPAWAPEHQGSAYIAVHAGLSGMMLLAWRAGLPVGWALALGLGARLLLIGAEPFTSHDVERYLWDGAVLLEGLDPYRVHPDHAAAAALRASWPTPEEHAAYPTLYPPVSLALFALAALAGPVAGLWLWKAILAVAGMATLAIGHRLLARRGALAQFPLLALSPLLLLETGIGGHVDALAALAITAALWAADRGRPGLAGIALGLGTAIKLAPALLLWPLLWGCGPADRQRLVLGAGASLAAVYALTLLSGLQPIGSLPVFFEKWRFGAPLFSLVEGVWPQSARGIMAGVGLLLVGAAGPLARRDRLAGAALALSAPWLVSPVVFPWYLMVLVPIAALRPGGFLLLWLSLTPLSYEVLDRFAAAGLWDPAIWPLTMIAGGWALGAWAHCFPKRNTAFQRRPLVPAAPAA